MIEMRIAKQPFFSRFILLVFIPCYLFFVGLSIKAIRLIVDNYGIEGEEWRVIFSSVSLILSSLFLITPFWAKAYVKRKFEAQKKAE